MGKPPRPVELDGRTGEGGGQLVRNAVALAAVTTTPVRIVHVRGNREGKRGGGLKSQHVTSLAWLARATAAEVEGLHVGSHTFEFRPRRGPADLVPQADADGVVRIVADSPAASALLVFQAVFPFLLFAGGGEPRAARGGEDGEEREGPAASAAGETIQLEISGGTNVSWSPTFEYVDQVLLPALEDRFGVRVDRRLEQRGWSAGAPLTHGRVRFGIRPLPAGEALRPRGPPPPAPRRGTGVGAVRAVDASVVAPADMHEHLARALSRSLAALFPGAEVAFRVLEDSGRETRAYVLLVARSGALRWGRDVLSQAKRGKRGGAAAAELLSAQLAQRVARDLRREVARGGEADEFLQDQLVLFQALAEGRTRFPPVAEAAHEGDDDGGDGEDVGALEGGVEALEIDEGRMRRDKTQEPFGFGSLHTTTARWVTAEMLPTVQWFNNGTVCDGVGMRAEKREAA